MTSSQIQTMILILTQYSWGAGSTETEAKDSARKAGGSLKKYIVFEVPEGTYVDGYGRFVYPDDAAYEHGAKVVRRYRWPERKGA